MEQVVKGRSVASFSAKQKVNYAVLVPLFMAVFLSVLDYAVANIALPAISHALQITSAQSVWIVNAYQLANAMLLLPLAAWGDRIGSARLCLIGLIIIIFGSTLCSIASSFYFLVFARVVQGVGGACVMSVSAALVRTVYPHHLLGKGLALNALVTALGFASSPAIAAAILSVASWRWLFLFNIPYGLFVIVLGYLYFPKQPIQKKPVDFPAAALNIVGLGCLLMAGDWFAHGGNTVAGVGIAVLGILSLWVLVRNQNNQEMPLFPADLLKISRFRMAVTVCFLGYVAANFFMISIPFTLTSFFHRSVVTAGLVITLWPVGMMIAGPVVARLADRVNIALLTSGGLIVVGIGYLLLRFCPVEASNLNIAWRLAFAGMGFAFFVAPNNKAIMISAPVSRSRSASAMISLARIVGQTTGATLVACVFTWGGQSMALTCLEFGALTAWFAAFLSAARFIKIS